MRHLSRLPPRVRSPHRARIDHLLLPVLRPRGAQLVRALRRLRRVEHAGRGAEGRRRRRQRAHGRAGGAAGKPVALRDVSAPPVDRLRTEIAELDRVLGGGLVPGSLVLLGGSPGIGKSTLTGMALGNLGAAGHQVLYISGEESAAQVRLRAERLGEAALAVPALAETSLEAVVATLEAERPDACVIDSVQTMHSGRMTGAPGLGRPGARGGRRGDGGGEADRLRGDPGRPRDQGRSGRGPARARAPGRLRALLRGRARAQLPHPARAQEPLRRDQRGRRVRDASGRAGRGRGRRRRASSPRRAPRRARWS